MIIPMVRVEVIVFGAFEVVSGTGLERIRAR